MSRGLGDVYKRQGAGRVIHEEKLVRCHRLLSFHPANRLIRHVDGEMITLRLWRSDPGNTVVDQGEPLIRFASDESVKLVKSLSRVGVWIGPPNVLGPPKPISSINTITTLGAFSGAVTSKNGGVSLTLRTSSSL